MESQNKFVTDVMDFSIVVATDAPVPAMYSNTITRLTEENLLDVVKSRSNYKWFYASPNSNISDDLLQAVCELTDKQMDLLKLAACGDLAMYLTMKRWVRDSAIPVYHILADASKFSRQLTLRMFINNSEILYDARRQEDENTN